MVLNSSTFNIPNFQIPYDKAYIKCTKVNYMFQYYNHITGTYTNTLLTCNEATSTHVGNVTLYTPDTFSPSNNNAIIINKDTVYIDLTDNIMKSIIKY